MHLSVYVCTRWEWKLKIHDENEQPENKQKKKIKTEKVVKTHTETVYKMQFYKCLF